MNEKYPVTWPNSAPSGYTRWYLYWSLLGTDWARVTPSAEMMAPRGCSNSVIMRVCCEGCRRGALASEDLEVIELDEQRPGPALPLRRRPAHPGVHVRHRAIDPGLTPAPPAPSCRAGAGRADWRSRDAPRRVPARLHCRWRCGARGRAGCSWRRATSRRTRQRAG